MNVDISESVVVELMTNQLIDVSDMYSTPSLEPRQNIKTDIV